jgi:hypothetical protein
LEQKALSATHAAFKATYRARGSAATIVFAQDGGQSSFTAGTTSYYSAGTADTVCDVSGGTPSCYTGAKPLSGLLSLISPAAVAGAIDTAATSSTSLNHSTEHHGGQLSSCISYTEQSQPVKYCLDDQGVVTYIKIPTAAFDLSAYSSSVTSADVSVPSDATLQPEPAVS